MKITIDENKKITADQRIQLLENIEINLKELQQEIKNFSNNLNEVKLQPENNIPKQVKEEFNISIQEAADSIDDIGTNLEKAMNIIDTLIKQMNGLKARCPADFFKYPFDQMFYNIFQ